MSHNNQIYLINIQKKTATKQGNPRGMLMTRIRLNSDIYFTPPDNYFCKSRGCFITVNLVVEANIRTGPRRAPLVQSKKNKTAKEIDQL